MTSVTAFVSRTVTSLADADLVNAAPAFAVDHFSPRGGTHACTKALLAGTLDFAVTAGVMHESKPFSPKVLRNALRPRPSGGHSAIRNPEKYHQSAQSARFRNELKSATMRPKEVRCGVQIPVSILLSRP